MACAGLAIPSARDAGHCGANRFSHAVNRVLSLNALERNYSLRFESLLPAFIPSAAESTKAAQAQARGWGRLNLPQPSFGMIRSIAATSTREELPKRGHRWITCTAAAFLHVSRDPAGAGR